MGILALANGNPIIEGVIVIGVILLVLVVMFGIMGVSMFYLIYRSSKASNVKGKKKWA